MDSDGSFWALKVLNCPYEFYCILWVFMCFYALLLVIMGLYKSLFVLMDSNASLWVLMGFYAFF